MVTLNNTANILRDGGIAQGGRSRANSSLDKNIKKICNEETCCWLLAGMLMLTDQAPAINSTNINLDFQANSNPGIHYWPLEQFSAAPSYHTC